MSYSLMNRTAPAPEGEEGKGPPVGKLATGRLHWKAYYLLRMHAVLERS